MTSERFRPDTERNRFWVNPGDVVLNIQTDRNGLPLSSCLYQVRQISVGVPDDPDFGEVRIVLVGEKTTDAGQAMLTIYARGSDVREDGSAPISGRNLRGTVRFPVQPTRPVEWVTPNDFAEWIDLSTNTSS